MRSPVPEDRSIAADGSVSDRDQVQRLRALAADLKDARILRVNSTATGGGVAEVLLLIVPSCPDLGVDTDWLAWPTTTPSSR
ncbi:hypothetical protein [Natronococcus wangiae]|uniref:hypothetical protein n=1 Tax=Natronococcus wangiae TaxID=3068275 RepID=UPI003133AE1B